MAVRSGVLRLGGAVAAVVGLCAMQGCMYLQNRGEDALEMVDLGVTVSKRAQFALYSDCVSLTPLGYGRVDSSFVGLGGGHVGLMDNREGCTGLLLWGCERLNWRESGSEEPSVKHAQGAGVLGVAMEPTGSAAYKPSCIKHLHLGWVGLMFNLRMAEIADFVLGWFGPDIAGDDGKEQGPPWYGE
jgi:hypothetical protein